MHPRLLREPAALGDLWATLKGEAAQARSIYYNETAFNWKMVEPGIPEAEFIQSYGVRSVRSYLQETIAHLQLFSAYVERYTDAMAHDRLKPVRRTATLLEDALLAGERCGILCWVWLSFFHSYCEPATEDLHLYVIPALEAAVLLGVCEAVEFASHSMEYHLKRKRTLPDLFVKVQRSSQNAREGALIAIERMRVEVEDPKLEYMFSAGRRVSMAMNGDTLQSAYAEYYSSSLR